MLINFETRIWKDLDHEAKYFAQNIVDFSASQSNVCLQDIQGDSICDKILSENYCLSQFLSNL